MRGKRSSCPCGRAAPPRAGSRPGGGNGLVPAVVVSSASQRKRGSADGQYQSVDIALENSRMKRPTSATAEPTQKTIQFGPGLEIGNAMPPMQNPTMVRVVP